MSATTTSVVWIGWARRIFSTPDNHLAACRSAGGAQTSSLDLNPGFVGLRYPADGGGVLCLGLANGPTPPDLLWHGRTRSELARKWIGPDASLDDDNFYRQWQGDFVQEVETWPYWKKHFSPVLDPLGLEPRDVAHTNLAPCQMRTNGSGPALAQLCVNQHPIRELLVLLRPAVILAATQLAEPARGLLGIDALVPPPIVLAWHGLNFTQDGEPRRTWLPRELGAIRERLSQT